MPTARRTDTELRKSINSLEKMLTSRPNSIEILTRITHVLVDLLNANYGFTYQCRPEQKNGCIPWNFVTSIRKYDGVITQIPAQTTYDRIPEHHFDRLMVGKPILFEGDDLALVPAPSNHPQMHNCLGVPLSCTNKVYGVIYIANVAHSQFVTAIERLRPFIASANCLLRVSETNEQNNPRAPLAASKKGDMFALETIFKVFDSLFNTVVLVDKNQIIVICNQAASLMFGLSKHQIVGKHINYFLPQGSPQTDARTSMVIEKADLPRAVWRGVPILRGDRARALVDLATFDFSSPIGVFKGYTMDDISERMESAANYHDTLQRFQVLTNIAPVGIVQINTDWECTYANDTWCSYTQMTPQESIGTGWLKGLHHNDSMTTLNKLRVDCSTEGQFESEMRLQTPLGKVTWVKANACVVFNSNGESDGLIITFSDITDRLKNEKRLQTIAERDQLTGLVNRAFFNDRLEIALKGVSRFGAVALIFLDLDDFKHINDTLGHDAGDMLLEQIAQRLTASLREVDTIARIGGDEFTLILTNVECIGNVSIVADKLIESLVEPFQLNNRPIYASASVGISYTDSTHQDPKTVLKQADIALYKAKEAGKNQYRFYSEELDQHAHLNILLRQSLKDGERDDFSVLYQPQVDASTKTIVGIEALSRWHHENANTNCYNIETCVKIVEQTGLINEFSDWLFRQVFSDVGEWLRKGILGSDVRVSINVSAKQFRNKELSKFIHSNCVDQGINPKSITLEITESAIIDDPKLVFEILRQLSLLGFRISLDDFGTGYSSLSYLQKMPIDEVKIDRSFIKDISESEEDRKIVLAIINLVKTLDLSVVAEGVDSSEIKDWLCEQNCHIQQGFYFHKPMKKSKIETLLGIKTTKSSDKVVRLKG